MASKDEVEEAISQTIDNLHQPYLVIGKKKEHNPLEEFWMNKLEAIESQYDQHIVKLERALLDNRVNKRRLIKKDDQITRLKGELDEKSNKLEKLAATKTHLQDELSLKSYKTTILGQSLTNTEELRQKVLKSLESERFERIQREKELVSLKHQLIKLERDKKYLFNDVSIKEGERRRVEDENAQLAQNKYNLIKNLTEIDQERRIQAEVNLKLVQDVGELLQGCKTREYTLLKQRTDINLMLEHMKQKRKEQEETLRKLGIQQKRMQEMHHGQKVSKETMEHLERQVMHWKEEFQFKENVNQTASLQIKDLHRENSQLRCQLAVLREKLNFNESHMKSLDTEKRRTEIELEKAKGQARSVHLLMCRNEIVKQKLSKRVWKAHPHVKQLLDESRGSTKWRDNGEMSTSKSKNQASRDSYNEIRSYKKKIWELEKQKRNLEMKLNELGGKQNKLRFQLKKFDGMEKQVLWAEKGMVKLEGDRNRLEDLMKSMALNVPKKLPFAKLVTDPSILDRMANYQVLQKRLLQQTEKVESLKKSAIKVMEYRKLQFEDEETDKRQELPKWKLARWKDSSSEDTLADVDQQPFDDLQQPPGLSTTMTDRKYYKDYMNYLDTEIPVIKQKIAVLERKQHYHQQQLLDAEEKAKSASTAGRVRHSDEDIWKEEEDEVEGGGNGSGDDDEDDEGGLAAVVSIDEPLSARRESSPSAKIEEEATSRVASAEGDSEEDD